MAQLMFVNKRKRGSKGRFVKSGTKKKARARRASPKRRKRSRALGDWPNNAPGHSRAAVKGYRRRGIRAKRHVLGGYRINPSPRALLGGLVMPAAMSAAGALAVDVAWGFMPLPEGIKTGPMRYLAKGAGAIALGMAVGMINKKFGHSVALGGLTVTVHSAMRDALARFAPTVALGAYADEMAAIGWDGDESSFAGFGYQEPGMGYQEPALGFQETGMDGLTDDYTQPSGISNIDYE